MSDQPNKRIGDYEILNELGQGGMGRVYKVRNVISDRVEAMKILLPELSGRQELAARFLREIKLVASLDHPNIGELRTALMLEDQLVMIMEFIEGTSLAERVHQGPLPVAEALNYIYQVLTALSYAHRKGVVHRDIKPANMMLTSAGIVKVMDFGVAFSGSEHKLTATGTTLGSLAYMSPEQVRGEPADPRSDLYSVGISLYEMATGQQPFCADSDFAIMTAHVKQAPRPPIDLRPELPAAVNAVILHAIAKDKNDRFQSADEFREALSQAAAAQQDSAGASTVIFSPSATPVPAHVPAATSYNRPSAPSAPAMAATTIATPTPSSARAPAAAPVAAAPAAVAAAPAPRQSGLRGLYMAIGAFVAIAALVVAGTYYRSGAFGSKQPPATPPPVSTAQPASPPAAQPATTPVEQPAAQPVAQPASEPAATSGPTKTAQKTSPRPAAIAPVAPPVGAVKEPTPAPAPDNSAQLDELERQLDGLNSRVVAVDSSLETLQRRQQASGYNLRGDIAAKWESMKLNFSKAQEAFNARDAVRGKKYADMAEAACTQLERFLGR